MSRTERTFYLTFIVTSLLMFAFAAGAQAGIVAATVSDAECTAGGGGPATVLATGERKCVGGMYDGLGLNDDPDPTSDGEYISTPLECRARGGEWIVTDGSGVCVIDDPEPVGARIGALVMHRYDHRFVGGVARVVQDDEYLFAWLALHGPAPLPFAPFGTCDSTKECKQATEDLCKDNGHGGSKQATVNIHDHGDGSKTCSADCEKNGAVAFVTCKATPQPSVELP